MTGLLIGEKHTYNDFGLRMISLVVSPPEAIVVHKEIPGMDSVLDFSEAFGEVKYRNRSLVAEFNMEEHDNEKFHERFSEICNYMHGIKHKITLDSDSAFYYEGRITVSSSPQGCFYKITISADVRPYKLKKEKTVITTNVVGKATVVCNNLKKRVVPTIKTDAEFGIVFDGVPYAVTGGEWTDADIVLEAGKNVLECTGTGSITFEYQEGGL